MIVFEWARRAIRSARRAETAGDPARKLAVIHTASAQSFPTADVEEMLAQIERGYLDEASG